MNGYMDFAGEPFLANKAPKGDAFTMGDYDAMTPGQGFAGDATALASQYGQQRRSMVMMRPKSGAVPGWPGFFGWLAAVHPKFYDYARVSLPNIVEDRAGIMGSGAQLGAYLEGAMGYYGSHGRLTETGSMLNGLVDESWDDPADPIMGALDMSSIINIGRGVGQAATEGITDSTPLPTSSGSSMIADTLTKLATAFVPLYGQKKILDLQIERARQGLPPLDTSNIIDPNAGLNVGLTKGTQNTVLMVAGLGLAALLLMKLVKKR